MKGWADLKGQAVGVLGGTVAHDYLTRHHPDAVIQSNEDVANVIKLVADRRLPATVQDGPAATHFLKEYPELHLAGEPVKAGYYVIYYRKTDTALGAALDQAIADGLRDGTLRRIYEKYVERRPG
ncbi:MAG: transporter substrate-binding domain-containing protein [Gemmataceae bacterium]